MKITKQDIDINFKRLADALGLKTSMAEAEAAHERAFLTIDKYAPGGNPYQYRLSVVSTKGGAEYQLTHERMTKNEFYYYMQGAIDALDKRYEDLQARAAFHKGGASK